MLQKQITLKINSIAGWLTQEQLEQLISNLITAALVLVATYMAIKILCFISSRIFKYQPPITRPDQDHTATETEEVAEQQVLAKHFWHLSQVLINTFILYGGYFIAAIIILDVFNVKIISATDLKILGTKLLKIIAIVVGAKLVTSFGQTAIKQVFTRQNFPEGLWDENRTQTLEVLLRNILNYVVFFLAAITILEVFGVNTSAILASAGIIGLAVGFGAQNLVKDIISGFFILFENQLSVGDFVAVGNVVGTVEEVGLRTCKIRHWTGMLHIVPNGEIKQVTNYNRGQMMAVVTVGIAYEEDVDLATKVLQQEGEKAKQEIDAILETPVVQGITELTEYAVQIRVVTPTTIGKQGMVERELRRRFKYALDQAGIEIPYLKQPLTPLSK